MNASFRRDLIAQSIIVVAICAGGWFMFVQPRESEALRLEEILRAAEAHSADSPMDQLDAGLDRIAGVRESIRSVDEASNVVSDETRLFELVMRLAAETGISVRSVGPVSTGKRNDDNATVRRFRTEALLDGAYEDIAVFVGLLHREGRTIRLVRMTISPLNNTKSPLVVATMTFDAFGFEVPADLRNLAATHENGAIANGGAE